MAASCGARYKLKGRESIPWGHANKKQKLTSNPNCAVYPLPHALGPRRPGVTARRGVAGFQTPGTRDGDRAPPRGVDVKPPSREGPGGLREAGKALRTCPEGSWGPGGPGGPWSRDPGRPSPGGGGAQNGPRTRQGSGAGPRPRRRGGFYINPSRRGPVPAGLGSPGPGVSRTSSGGQNPLPAQAGKPPFFGPRDGYRAPPRGVDVTATPRAGALSRHGAATPRGWGAP